MLTVAKKRPSSAFGQRLRSVREQAGMTQAQLAEAVQVHRPEIARLESGTVEPTWPKVLKLAEALGVTPDAFMKGDNQNDIDNQVMETSHGDPPTVRRAGKKK